MKNMIVNATNKHKFTPLVCACFRGYMTKGQKNDAAEKRLKIVKCLLENGANAKHIAEETKLTALHWAAYRADYAVVKELLHHDALEF